MRKIILVAVAVLIAVLGVVLIANWTPRKYRVTGTITRDGKSLEWKSKKGVLLVLFAPADRTRDRTVYRYQEDLGEGNYVVEDIPAGKYVISVQQLDPYPTHDLLQFAYNLRNTTFEYEVAGDGEFNINLPKNLPRTGGGGRPGQAGGGQARREPAQ